MRRDDQSERRTRVIDLHLTELAYMKKSHVSLSHTFTVTTGYLNGAMLKISAVYFSCSKTGASFTSST